MLEITEDFPIPLDTSTFSDMKTAVAAVDKSGELFTLFIQLCFSDNESANKMENMLESPIEFVDILNIPAEYQPFLPLLNDINITRDDECVEATFEITASKIEDLIEESLEPGIMKATSTPVPIVAELIYLVESTLESDCPNEAIGETADIIAGRLKALGIDGAIVKTQDTNQIVIQLPEIDDMESVIGLISKTNMQLDFKELTEESWEIIESLIMQGTAPDYEELTQKGDIQWVPATAIDSTGAQVALNGIYVSNAKVITDEHTSEPMVAFEFNQEGARLFDQVTGRLVGKPLGIFVDGNYASSPRVNERISGGKGVIEGITISEAQDLAILLDTGAIPCTIKLISRIP